MEVPKEVEADGEGSSWSQEESRVVKKAAEFGRKKGRHSNQSAALTSGRLSGACPSRTK